MKTAVTQMFGIDVPILAFSHCRDVVAAVTKAGGMGVLGAVAHSPAQLEIDLVWIENEVGGKPLGTGSALTEFCRPDAYLATRSGPPNRTKWLLTWPFVVGGRGLEPPASSV